jgi:hypothetical protein
MVKRLEVPLDAIVFAAALDDLGNKCPFSFAFRNGYFNVPSALDHLRPASQPI